MHYTVYTVYIHYTVYTVYIHYTCTVYIHYTVYTVYIHYTCTVLLDNLHRDSDHAVILSNAFLIDTVQQKEN